MKGYDARVMDPGSGGGEEDTRRSALPELFLELGTDGTIHALRGRRISLFGIEIEPADAVGRRVSEVLSPSQADAIRDCVLRAIKTDSVVFTEHLTSAGGRRRFWQARTIPLGSDRALRVVTDMTEQLRWHQTLERSEIRFRQVVEQAVDGIFVCDEEGRLVDVNRQACESLGYSRDEMLTMNLVQLCQGLDMETLWELLDRLDPGQSETYAAAHLRRDGSTFPVELHLGPFWDHEGTPRILALARDVTDRQRLEKAALEAAEQEARRIGRDLHDGLGQHLTGMAFLAKGLERSLKDRGLPEAEEAHEIVKLVKEAVGHSRALAHGLAPVGVHGTELAPALENLAERTRDVFNIECEFEGDAVARVPDDATATAFYRIAQEATNNALKHGNPSRITISLTTDDDDDGLRLRIEDDGQGLPLTRPTEGLGLRLMKLRAETVGASMVIDNVSDEGGTRVEATLPGRAGARPRSLGLRPPSSPLPMASDPADSLSGPLVSTES